MDHEVVWYHQPNKQTKSIEMPSEESARKRHGARNQHKIKFFLRWLTQTFPSPLEAAYMGINAQEEENSKALNEHKVDMLDKEGTLNAGLVSEDNREVHTDPFFDGRLGSIILDVAGGKGELSARLSFCNNLRVVMVDPRPADVVQCYEDVVFRGLPKKWQTRLREKQASNPNILTQRLQERFRQLTIYFDKETFANDPRLRKAVDSAELMIGIHADGATEAIIDVALQYGKPFVVVPCCVFPNFFPHRKLVRNGIPQAVRTYEDFCEYLLQKDPRLQRSILPFEGRNIAIWWDGRSTGEFEAPQNVLLSSRCTFDDECA